MPIIGLNDISLKNDTKILIWELSESIDELKSLLSYIDLAELESKISDKRKREYLGVRVALKNMLGREITVKYDIQGKPYLADNSLNISVSHSGKWVAVMAHPTQQAGIDIEIPTEKIRKIATRFLCETELLELSDNKNIAPLQLVWSAKEALYKIIGKEAVDFAKQLRLFPFEVGSQGEISAEHIPTKKRFQLQYIRHSDYTLVYCLD